MPLARCRRAAVLPALLGAIACAGCSSSLSTSASSTNASGDREGKSLRVEPSFTQFPDIPVPSRSDMEVDRTLVFGGDSGWYGRLVLSSGHPPSGAFDFFKQEMPGFGWQPVTMVRSSESVLTYVLNGRVATIQITEGTLRGSEINITVAPRQAVSGGPPAMERPGRGGAMPTTVIPAR